MKTTRALSYKLSPSGKLAVGLLFSSWLMFYSCQKVDKPYLKWTAPIPPVGDTIRKVLLEDYTGHGCPNCPRVACALHVFRETLFKGQVIGLTVHAGSFASPNPKHPNDFRTPVSESYLTLLKVDQFPKGIINRRNKTDVNVAYNCGEDVNWKDSIQKILSKKPDALLKITNEYDPGSGKLVSSVKCSFLNTLPGSYNLVVLLTQDSIVSPQDNSSSSNYPPYPAGTPVNNYVHMHALRDCIDDPADKNGTGIPVGPFNAGTSVIMKLPDFFVPSFYPKGATSYTIKTVPKNCNVVAFIYNTSTNEVVQADEAKLMK
jgi:Outer membrane protein Omp28